MGPNRQTGLHEPSDADTKPRKKLCVPGRRHSVTLRRARWVGVNGTARPRNQTAKEERCHIYGIAFDGGPVRERPW